MDTCPSEPDNSTSTTWNLRWPDPVPSSYDIPQGAFGLFPLLLSAGRWETLADTPIKPAGPGSELYATLHSFANKEIWPSLKRLLPAGLNATGGKLAQDELTTLGELGNLKRLNLMGSRFEHPLDWLEELPRIEVLMLGKVDGEMLLPSLGHLSNLAALWIGGPTVSTALTALSGLDRLISLLLQNSSLKPTDLARLPSSLLELQLAGSNLGDDHLSCLTTLPSLRVLNVANTGVRESVLATAIPLWHDLQVLEARGLRLTGDLLESVINHPSLHTLNVVDAPELEELRRLKPDLLCNGIRHRGQE